MFCPNCGNEVKNGARFCSVCGTDVVQAYEQANEELTQVDNGFQDVDSFDNTGFMLPNENAFSSPYNAEQQNVNDYIFEFLIRINYDFYSKNCKTTRSFNCHSIKSFNSAIRS